MYIPFNKLSLREGCVDGRNDSRIELGTPYICDELMVGGNMHHMSYGKWYEC